MVGIVVITYGPTKRILNIRIRKHNESASNEADSLCTTHRSHGC